jgi:hypothetical protein
LEVEAQPALAATEAHGAELASVGIDPVTLDAEHAGNLSGVDVPHG